MPVANSHLQILNLCQQWIERNEWIKYIQNALAGKLIINFDMIQGTASFNLSIFSLINIPQMVAGKYFFWWIDLFLTWFPNIWYVRYYSKKLNFHPYNIQQMTIRNIMRFDRWFGCNSSSHKNHSTSEKNQFWVNGTLTMEDHPASVSPLFDIFVSYLNGRKIMDLWVGVFHFDFHP